LAAVPVAEFFQISYSFLSSKQQIRQKEFESCTMFIGVDFI